MANKAITVRRTQLVSESGKVLITDRTHTIFAKAGDCEFILVKSRDGHLLWVSKGKLNNINTKTNHLSTALDWISNIYPTVVFSYEDI